MPIDVGDEHIRVSKGGGGSSNLVGVGDYSNYLLYIKILITSVIGSSLL